jgi:DNA-directed RNA polymerase sigma subunit (sigma70/sigma32)
MESLDAPLNDDGEDVMGDIIGTDAAPPDEIAGHRDTIEQMLSLVGDGILSDRERFIIEKRFGLDGNPALTLEEVGKQWGLTRERIRQCQVQGLLKLNMAIEKLDNVAVNIRKSEIKHVSRNLETSPKSKKRAPVNYAELRGLSSGQNLMG